MRYPTGRKNNRRASLSCCCFKRKGARGDQSRPHGKANTMIAIAPELHVPRGALPRRELSSFLRQACTAIPLEGEISVLLTSDAAMQALNRTFRRKNKPTDVLSFPAAAAPVGPRLAGDLAVSLETAARQAGECGHSLLVETKILLLHGLLHLAGFDHERDGGEMGRRERELRMELALPAGLIQRAGASRGAGKAGLDRGSAPDGGNRAGAQ